MRLEEGGTTAEILEGGCGTRNERRDLFGSGGRRFPRLRQRPTRKARTNFFAYYRFHLTLVERKNTIPSMRASSTQRGRVQGLRDRTRNTRKGTTPLRVRRPGQFEL